LPKLGRGYLSRVKEETLSGFYADAEKFPLMDLHAYLLPPMIMLANSSLNPDAISKVKR